MSHASEPLLMQGWQARREHRLKDAKRYFTEAIELCRADGGLPLARALVALGEIERNPEDRNLARQHYEEAIAIYRVVGDPGRVAHAVRHLGDICYEDGRPDLAEPCFHEALALYRADPATGKLDLANAIRSLAVLREEHGDPEEAAQLWQEARELYEAVNVQEGVSESSARLARIAGRRGLG